MTRAILVLALVLVGCSVDHVAPSADAGIVDDAAPPLCLEWRERADPEDVYCARWSR